MVDDKTEKGHLKLSAKEIVTDFVVAILSASVIGGFGKISTLQDTITKNEVRITDLKEEIKSIKEDNNKLPTTYVSREEFRAVVDSLDKRVDGFDRKLDNQNTKMDRIIEILMNEKGR